MSAYYNEIDPFAAAWLRELIKDGLIADGEVDERSIADVSADDVRGFVQCHWFAGIGGWSYALRLAGWTDDRPVWTGSCPCQPFSSAGTQAGGDDPRHLWPAWFRLIRERRPAVVFGEQVESAIAHGWLDLVCDDLEGEGYAVGAVGLPAASVGAPHIRQRLWFVAESEGARGWADAGAIRTGQAARLRDAEGQDERGPSIEAGRLVNLGSTGELAESGGERFQGQRLRVQPRAPRRAGAEVGRGGEIGELADADKSEPSDSGLQRSGRLLQPAEDAVAGERMADTEHAKRRAVGIDGQDGRDRPNSGRAEAHGELGTCGEVRGVGYAEGQREVSKHGVSEGAQPQPDGSFWFPCDWLPCRDGKARPVEPGTFPLAHGISGRMVVCRASQQAGTAIQEHWYNRTGALRGFGNAIVPPLAAEFIKAYCEVTL